MAFCYTIFNVLMSSCLYKDGYLNMETLGAGRIITPKCPVATICCWLELILSVNKAASRFVDVLSRCWNRVGCGDVVAGAFVSTRVNFVIISGTCFFLAE